MKKELSFYTKIVLRFLKNRITWAQILKWHLDAKRSIKPNVIFKFLEWVQKSIVSKKSEAFR